LTPSECAGWYRSQVLREKLKAGRLARDRWLRLASLVPFLEAKVKHGTLDCF